ncbi:hypothetical protein [Sandaracinobacter neustonicus]|uniref:hypothetical protein n=1 Tax=Sandaracinobacter neustonicus TaxID=1715348 RepID=UPI0015E30DF3|nr:hypothetical protein [Sandaracinobacter neustonicus]
MSARFTHLIRLPLFGIIAIMVGGLNVLVAAGPAIAAPAASSVSAIPSALSPEAAHAA